jgi:hypothetical protein
MPWETMYYYHKNECSEAMQDEMKSLYENDAFELVYLTKGKKSLKNKWVYRVENITHIQDTRLDWLWKFFFIKRRVLSLMRCSLELSRGFWSELPYHGLENWLAWHEYNILACMMSYRRRYTWISQKNSWLQARSTKYAYWRIACIWLESSSLEMV